MSAARVGWVVSAICALSTLSTRAVRRDQPTGPRLAKLLTGVPGTGLCGCEKSEIAYDMSY